VSIGLVQALTSVQEMTLTFVPKLAAIAVVFWMSMHFMTNTLVAFFHDQIIPLIIGG
jgi:flagellar biosynthetic protein FliQ